MLKINKIENIDCHIYLKKIDTNSINLIVIDPPYNELPKKWDNFKSWNFIKKEFLRILKKMDKFTFLENNQCFQIYIVNLRIFLILDLNWFGAREKAYGQQTMPR